ncbi:MAG: MATE family efflux transporter [Clostridia bacterium]|nr:MATE family efflux transporter [Clostridia bacterium]
MRIQLSDHFNYKKLFLFTVPSIAMMIFTSIYGVVDGFFVSNYAGDIPFKAVNLIMPFLIILGTVGFIFGTGGTAIVANVLGVGEKKKANEYFSLFVYVVFILGILFALFGIAFIRPIAALLGAKGEILENCVLYGRIVLCALPFLVLQYMFQSFFVAAEKPRLGLFVIIAAGVTNMVLDAVLVISLPQQYKIAGAAIATAASQFVGGSIPLIYFFRRNGSLLRLGRTHFDGRAIWKACVNGSSEFMANVSMSFVGMLYNLQLLKYAGDDGVAAYGVMMYVSMIFSAVFIGYAMGTAPLVSYHDGAENHEELKGILKRSLIVIGVCGVVMLAFAELLAAPLAKLFVGYSEELTAMTVNGFRMFAICFPFMGYAIYFSSFFTALNDGLTSALISFLRTLVLQLGAVYLLPLAMGLNGIWLSVAVAEFAAVVFSVVFMLLKRKKYHY